MAKAKERIFVDINGAELIVRHRKSAVFFERISNGQSENKGHPEYYTEIASRGEYTFTPEGFKEFCDYCVEIANESWVGFTPKEADSTGADYDDYYDREFDNNGRLGIGTNSIRAEGPYAQPALTSGVVRLIKFNKRKFESFVFDLVKRGGVETC